MPEKLAFVRGRPQHYLHFLPARLPHVCKFNSLFDPESAAVATWSSLEIEL